MRRQSMPRQFLHSWAPLLWLTVLCAAGCSGGQPGKTAQDEAKKAGHIVVLWREPNDLVEVRHDASFKVRFVRVNEPTAQKYWVLVRLSAPTAKGNVTIGSSFRNDAQPIQAQSEGDLTCRLNFASGVSYRGKGTMKVLVIEDRPRNEPEKAVSNVLEVPVLIH